MATIAENQMFIYRGKNRKGEKVQGEVKADSVTAVKGQLRKQGIISTSIRKKPKPVCPWCSPLILSPMALTIPLCRS